MYSVASYGLFENPGVTECPKKFELFLFENFAIQLEG